MVIKSSDVNLFSSRDYSRNVNVKRRVTEWRESDPATLRVTAVSISRSYEEQSMYNNYNDLGNSLKKSGSQTSSGSTRSISDPPQTAESGGTDFAGAYLESSRKAVLLLLELLFGKERRLHDMEVVSYENRTLNLMSESQAVREAVINSSNVWNRVTEEKYEFQESESVAFSGTGTAITADGRTLSFGVSFSLSRDFCMEYEMESFEQYERVLTDPLVINLDSSPASLSDMTFLFDIDSDGTEEEISMLSGSSGFLALDKNNDGVINDGSELFGTASGNGFADLAAYDSDNNGWIDEADEVYSRLKVWMKDEDGRDILLSLKEADVGAICLGSASGSFSLNDKDNAINGVIRSSGVFLHESGMAGIIQQIDFANHM